MGLRAGADGDVPGRDDGESPVGAAFVREQRTEPGEGGRPVVDVDAGGEIAPDDEVRTFPTADLLGDDLLDDRGVFGVGDVEAVVVERDGCAGSAVRTSAVDRCRCSSTIMHRSGVPSSWVTNPRSRTWR